MKQQENSSYTNINDMS